MSVHPRTPQEHCTRAALLRERLKRGIPAYGEPVKAGGRRVDLAPAPKMRPCATCGARFWSPKSGEEPVYCPKHRKGAKGVHVKRVAAKKAPKLKKAA